VGDDRADNDSCPKSFILVSNIEKDEHDASLKLLLVSDVSDIGNFFIGYSSMSKTNINDFGHESLSPIINYSLFFPTSKILLSTFKKPYVKGKFIPNILIAKDGRNKESENDDLEVSFMNLNKLVTEHLSSKKYNAQMHNDTLFCNLIMAELKQLDDKVKRIKEQEFMQILYKKENL